VVAEESFSEGKIPDVSRGQFWLVDPLDGTKEFISRNGEFTVNIALIENGKPVLGVVYAPAIDQIFYAAGPGKVFRQRDGGDAEPIAARPTPDDGFDVFVSRSHADEKTEAFLDPVPVRSRISAGSSLKFCLIAAAEGDLYPRIGNTMEWDTAAGHAVLACAGGSVRDLDGKDLAYGKPGFRNTPFVARGAE
jgi:3'(2'), 5'-bisphosphate nucleotidase